MIYKIKYYVSSFDQKNLLEFLNALLSMCYKLYSRLIQKLARSWLTREQLNKK